ncbi:IS1380 family transposase [Candidatus Neomicrothrix sp.]|uniref:IS1380 family transposase n=1 Tax=Candidatus Neomicrothrix sp. TaxID=2719034 RepID=UPI001B6AF17E|nr:IS1380 family transposase [Candidatus Microthrix sp.]MBP7877780.1 IS1380 family transposase [Candidatus Microthrix sp.]
MSNHDGGAGESAGQGRGVTTLAAIPEAMRNRMDAYWRAANGSTRKALGFVPLAPSTIGTFLRSFKFGHVRQLDAVNSRLLANAWAAGAGPKPDVELVVDLDSTVTEVYGKQKQGASYGYTGVLGYHPLIATRAGTGEVLGSRMRKGAAGSSRGVLRFIGEVLATIGRAGVCGPVTVRADSGFWSWKLIDKLTKAGVGWSITVRLVPKIKTTIAAIPEEAWTTIDYTPGGHAQVAETIYTTGKGKQVRHVRLVVRRTRLADTAQAAMWPTWRHHAFICNNTLTTVEADRFHRNHAVVELAIRELKDNGLEHCPSGSFAANGAWLACAVLAHNLTRWTGIIGLDGPIRTARTIRNRIIALAGALVNRSGTPTLRLPTDWPWAHQFHAALTTIRALPTAGPP